MASDSGYEVLLIKTMVLADHEKSIRRVRIRSSKPTKPAIPACVTLYPGSLSAPELFVVRCIGSQIPHELRVCPVGINLRRHLYHPLGVNRITWTSDCSKEPHIEELAYSNFITGEELGIHQFTSSEYGQSWLPDMQSSLGDHFELVQDLDRSITVKISGKPTLYFSLSPNLIQVPSLDWHIVFESQIKYSDPAKVLNTFHEMLLVCWRKDRFDALGLIPIINRHLEDGLPISQHTIRFADEAAKAKLTSLSLFDRSFFRPLTSRLKDSTEFCLSLAEVHTRVLKEIHSLQSLMSSQAELAPRQLLHVLSQEIINVIPLDPAWWKQLQTALSVEGIAWFGSLVTTNSKQQSSTPPIYESWGRDPWVLRRSGLLLWQTCSKQNGRPIPSNVSLYKKAQYEDPTSRVRLATHPHIRFSNEYPWVSLHGATHHLFETCETRRTLISPNEFHRVPFGPNQILLVTYSDRGLAARLQQHLQSRVDWKVVAQSGWLLSLDSKVLPESPKLVCIEGQFTLNPLGSSTSAGPFSITQVAASRTDLFVIRAQGSHNVLMRVPILPNDPKVSLMELDNRPASLRSPGEPLSCLQRLSLLDPRYSHPLSYIASLRALFYAEVVLQPPVGLSTSPTASAVHGYRWWSDFTELDGWQFAVQLAAVRVESNRMQPWHCNTFHFPAQEFWLRSVGLSHLPPDLLVAADNTFVFRWVCLSKRIFGVWLKDSRAFTIFASTDKSFIIANQRSSRPTPLTELNKILPTSLRGDGLPILTAVCHSWRPTEPFVFEVRRISLRL